MACCCEPPAADRTHLSRFSLEPRFGEVSFFSSSRFLIDDSRLNGTRAKQSMLEFHPPRNVIYENQMLRIPWVAFRTEKIGCELSRISPRKIHYRTSRAQVDLAMNQREINNATHRGMKSLFFFSSYSLRTCLILSSEFAFHSRLAQHFFFRFE